jgi:hypothetical protein
MKALFFLLITLPLAASVLAQGKVRFVNDSLHLVYWTTDQSGLRQGDYGLAGQAYELGQAGVTFAIELWAGTVAASLRPVASTSFSGQLGPGTWFTDFVNLPSGFPGYTPAFFQVRIYDARDPSWDAAFWNQDYVGESLPFEAIPGTIAYNSIVDHRAFPPGAASTWDDGTFNLDSVSPGDRGAIELRIFVPEPSWSAFSGFALLLLFVRHSAEQQR